MAINNDINFFFSFLIFCGFFCCFFYRETGVHADPKFNHENGTITSIPKYPLEWVPEMSNGTEDDILTLPNVALLVSKIYSQLYVSAFI